MRSCVVWRRFPWRTLTPQPRLARDPWRLSGGPGASVGARCLHRGGVRVPRSAVCPCAQPAVAAHVTDTARDPESKATNGHSEGSRARRNPRGSASAPGPDLPYIRRAVYTAYICVHRRGVRRTPAFRGVGKRLRQRRPFFLLCDGALRARVGRRPAPRPHLGFWHPSRARPRGRACGKARGRALHVATPLRGVSARGTTLRVSRARAPLPVQALAAPAA